MTEVRRGSFESLVQSPETHVVLDLAGEGEALLILFGGIAGGVSMPVFEFFRLTSDIPGKKAFFRDPRRGWYQLGIPGIGESAQAVQDYLANIIAQANVARVVMAGASAGGFAAIQFGLRCGADEVFAFSPQSFLDAENRRLAGDDRWQGQIAALHASNVDRQLTLDLIGEWPANQRQTRIQIHVSNDDALDLLHAHRLAGQSGVEIIEHERGGHRLVKTLRDRGLLKPMLQRALTGNTPAS